MPRTRRSVRIQGHDYSESGEYFVTICTFQMRCLFGEIKNGQIRLNPFGQIVEGVRRQLAFRYLEEADLRTSKIAYMLGYSEPSAFNHAFRRWTGVSPSRFTSAE